MTSMNSPTQQYQTKRSWHNLGILVYLQELKKSIRNLTHDRSSPDWNTINTTYKHERDNTVYSHEVPCMDGARAGNPVFVRANIYVNDMLLYITIFGFQQNEWSHRNMPSGSASNAHKRSRTGVHKFRSPGRQANQATGVRTTAPNISEPLPWFPKFWGRLQTFRKYAEPSYGIAFFPPSQRYLIHLSDLPS